MIEMPFLVFVLKCRSTTRVCGDRKEVIPIMTFNFSKTNKRILVGGIVFVVFSYIAVELNELYIQAVRHESIHKDIERERWRAKQLGLQDTLVDSDDGFAEDYMATYRTPRPLVWLAALMPDKNVNK